MTEQTAGQRIASHWSITCATEICAAIDAAIASVAAAKDAEIRRLTGCLLVIAGTPSSVGGGSIRTAAGEAALIGASVDDIGRKLENPTAEVWRARTTPQADPQENV